MRPSLLLALLGACVDYDLSAKDENAGADDTARDTDPDDDRACPRSTFPWKR